MDTEIVLWLFGASITLQVAIIGAIWKHKGDVHKALFDKIAAQEKALNDFRVEVAKEYVTREALKEVGDRLGKAFSDGLHEVSTSLNNLAKEFHEHQLEDRK